jgi:hypothetical protein
MNYVHVLDRHQSNLIDSFIVALIYRGTHITANQEIDWIVASIADQVGIAEAGWM